MQASFTGLEASIFGVFTNLFTGVLKLMLISALFLKLFESVPHYRVFIFVVILFITIIWFYVGSFVRLGYIDYNLAMLDKRRPHSDFLFAVNAVWGNTIYLRIRMILRVCLGSCLFIIPGIILFYDSAMAPFLLEERKNITVSEALRMSKEKMRGHRWDYFCLRLSFLGWRILGILSLGIAFLWINPYYALAETVFFNEVSGRADEVYNRVPRKSRRNSVQSVSVSE